MQKIIPALIKARAKFQKIQKDKTNPHYKSKYASLDAVIEAVDTALASEGLTVVQIPNVKDGKTVLTTHLLHSSGESICGDYPLPDHSDPQKLGSAVTYARRYSLCSILNVVADEDDDGNAALPAKSTAKPKPVNDPEREGLMEQVSQEMKRLSMSIDDGKSLLQEMYGVTTRQRLSNEQLKDFLEYLQVQPLAG